MIDIIIEIRAWFIMLETTKSLNRMFRKYLEAEPMPKVPDAPLPRSVNILIGIVRCSQSEGDAV
jgi:hypothetical protein